MSALTPDPTAVDASAARVRGVAEPGPHEETPPLIGPERLTVEEFLRDYPDRYAELRDGVPVVNEPTNPEYVMPGSYHGQVSVRISAAILQHVKQHALGHVASHDSFVIVSQNPAVVLGPDVYFIPYTRAPRGQRLPEAVPADWLDLAVEVKSPYNTWTELFGKAEAYLAAGTKVVVLLDPGTAAASVHRPGANQELVPAGGTLTLPDILPGFAVPLPELFE